MFLTHTPSTEGLYGFWPKNGIREYAFTLLLTPPPPQTWQVSWTQALRTIVKNCYKQHGREDLLYAFEDQQTQPATATHSIAHLVPSQTVVQTFSNPDGTVSLIQVRVHGSWFFGRSWASVRPACLGLWSRRLTLNPRCVEATCGSSLRSKLCSM